MTETLNFFIDQVPLYWSLMPFSETVMLNLYIGISASASFADVGFMISFRTFILFLHIIWYDLMNIH